MLQLDGPRSHRSTVDAGSFPACLLSLSACPAVKLCTNGICSYSFDMVIMNLRAQEGHLRMIRFPLPEDGLSLTAIAIT